MFPCGTAEVSLSLLRCAQLSESRLTRAHRGNASAKGDAGASGLALSRRFSWYNHHIVFGPGACGPNIVENMCTGREDTPWGGGQGAGSDIARGRAALFTAFNLRGGEGNVPGACLLVLPWRYVKDQCCVERDCWNRRGPRYYPSYGITMLICKHLFAT